MEWIKRKLGYFAGASKSEKKVRFEDEQQQQRDEKEREEEFVQVNLPGSASIQTSLQTQPELSTDNEDPIGLASIPQLEPQMQPSNRKKAPNEPIIQKPVVTKKLKKAPNPQIIHQPK